MRNNDRETYAGVYECFGRGLKYAIYNSFGSLKESLADLLLFYSAKQEKMITLREYLDAAGDTDADNKADSAAKAEDEDKDEAEGEADDATEGKAENAADSAAEGDEKTDAKTEDKTDTIIYYAAGKSEDMLAKMPMVRAVLAKGHDVLLCTQDVDDFCLTAMRNYDFAPLKNVAGSDLGLETEAEKQHNAEVTKDNEQLFTAMQEILKDKVNKVVVSSRLADAAAGITATGTISLEMEKVMNADPGDKDIRAERVLELNPTHPVFDKLTQTQDQGDKERVRLYTNILYNQALLVEGLPIEDPVAFAQDLSELLL
jgi:molecular chaperone HtpG